MFLSSLLYAPLFKVNLHSFHSTFSPNPNILIELFQALSTNQHTYAGDIESG